MQYFWISSHYTRCSLVFPQPSSPTSLSVAYYSLLYGVSQEERSIRVGGHSIGHAKQKSVYVNVFYSERFPRESYFTVKYTVHCTDEQHAISSHELQSALMLNEEFSKSIILRKL
jgi:hypothetical protein